MSGLIKLEIKRNKLNTYYLASGIICAIMTGFIYFIAIVAKVENDIEFLRYENIFKLHSVLNFIIFCIFSVVMYSKFVIEDYSKGKALLLFSYPIARWKIFFAKLILVITFTLSSLLVCSLVPIALFSISESISPILSGEITLALILSQLLNIGIYAVAITSIGLISLGIGFIKKSIATTVVSAIFLASIIGNMVIGLGASMLAFVAVSILFVIGIATTIMLTNKINAMNI